jgi:hypothetical protein
MSIATAALVVGILVRDVHEQLSNLERIFLQCPVSAHATCRCCGEPQTLEAGHVRCCLFLPAFVAKNKDVDSNSPRQHEVFHSRPIAAITGGPILAQAH